MDTSPPQTYERCPGLALLFNATQLYTPKSTKSRDDTWIQCDECFRWRKSVGVLFSNGLCQRWFCSDAGRRCNEPCDFCRVADCLCAPSQTYCGYSTSGYSLPEGYSVLIRFRHEEGIEVGKPWLSYRSWCSYCGKKSRAIDRRDYMQRWLETHRPHNPKWERLTTEAFDFKLDARTRDMYLTYQKLYKRGVLQCGIRNAVKQSSPMIMDEEKKLLKSFLEIVEASRFFDEKNTAAGRARSVRKAAKYSDVQSPDGMSVKSAPACNRSRRTPPAKISWMFPADEWVTEEDLLQTIRRPPSLTALKPNSLESDQRQSLKKSGPFLTESLRSGHLQETKTNQTDASHLRTPALQPQTSSPRFPVLQTQERSSHVSEPRTQMLNLRVTASQPQMLNPCAPVRQHQAFNLGVSMTQKFNPRIPGTQYQTRDRRILRAPPPMSASATLPSKRSHMVDSTRPIGQTMDLPVPLIKPSLMQQAMSSMEQGGCLQRPRIEAQADQLVSPSMEANLVAGHLIPAKRNRPSCPFDISGRPADAQLMSNPPVPPNHLSDRDQSLTEYQKQLLSNPPPRGLSFRNCFTNAANGAYHQRQS